MINHAKAKKSRLFFFDFVPKEASGESVAARGDAAPQPPKQPLQPQRSEDAAAGVGSRAAKPAGSDFPLADVGNDDHRSGSEPGTRKRSRGTEWDGPGCDDSSDDAGGLRRLRCLPREERNEALRRVYRKEDPQTHYQDLLRWVPPDQPLAGTAPAPEEDNMIAFYE